MRGSLTREKVLVPALERLGHHGVVGVGHRADRDVPRLFPRELMLVDQHAHQLGDYERGMRVVDVNGDLVGQVVKGFILRKMVVENILQRRTDEEILLRQPQQLALGVVIRRVEHLRDGLGHRVLLHSLDILPLRKGFHIEIADVARLPQPQHADGLAVGAGNEHIVGHGLHLVAVVLRNMADAVLPPLLHAAAEADGHGAVLPRTKPDLAPRGSQTSGSSSCSPSTMR